MLLEVYCDVRVPALAAEMINLGVVGEDMGEIIRISITMLLYVTGSIVVGVASAYCASKASVNFSCDLREDMFAKIQSFSFKNIDKFSTGSLVTRLTNDITQMQNLVNTVLRMLFRAPGMLIGSMVMAYTINADIANVFLVLLPVLSIIIWIVMSLSLRRFTILQEHVDKLNSNISEFLTNIRLIKALTREKHESTKFDGVNSELKKVSLSAFLVNILQMPLMTITVNISTIIVIWLGSLALNKGELLIGDISAFVTYLSQFLMSVMMLAMVFLNISRAMASSKRIKEVLDTNPNIVDGSNKEITVTSGNVEFKNVDFKYYSKSEKLVLENVNLSIKSGQTVGVIGSTGSGKTSLVHLIARLYDVTSGSVLVDGKDVRDYTLKNLRESVAVVLQNNVLFSGTIKDNLHWGDKNATQKELDIATDWAAANTFINEQEHGFDTVLGQGGINLSGGQKQRLCIARAILKKPKILILDDSTSAVDTKTEQKINHHLNNELKDTTKIIIAQRITSVVNCDLIIVVNDGMIEALGKHEELMSSSNTYQEIYQSQVSKEAK